eukprot:1704486-Pleurochrysis_carterae.AAC.2
MFGRSEPPVLARDECSARGLACASLPRERTGKCARCWTESAAGHGRALWRWGPRTLRTRGRACCRLYECLRACG